MYSSTLLLYLLRGRENDDRTPRRLVMNDVVTLSCFCRAPNFKFDMSVAVVVGRVMGGAPPRWGGGWGVGGGGGCFGSLRGLCSRNSEPVKEKFMRILATGKCEIDQRSRSY